MSKVQQISLREFRDLDYEHDVALNNGADFTLDAQDEKSGGEKFTLSCQIFTTLLLLPPYILGIKAKLELSTQDKCDLDNLDGNLTFFLVLQSILLIISLLLIIEHILFKVNILTPKPFNNRETILSTTAPCIIFPIIMLKVVWFILFAISYTEESNICLELKQDTLQDFTVAYNYLKPLLIIESVPFSIIAFVCALLIICLPCIVYVFNNFCETLGVEIEQNKRQNKRPNNLNAARFALYTVRTSIFSSAAPDDFEIEKNVMRESL